MKIENRRGVLYLYGHMQRPIQVRTVGTTLQAAGCGCELHLDTLTGRVTYWQGKERLRGVFLTQIYHLWPELKERGQYQPVQLKPRSEYSKQLANAIAITTLVLTWGGALALAILFPIQTMVWSIVRLIQIFLLLTGVALIANTYFDHWLYHEKYDARPNNEKDEQPPSIDAEAEVMSHVELQMIWNSVRPLTLDNGEVYRIFDPQKLSRLRQLESRLGIDLPPIEDSGWARIGVNERVADENNKWLQSQGRYHLSFQASV